MIEKVKRAMLAMARQCWEQGVAAQAMLELGDMETMRLMARDCVVRQNADGRLCDVENTPASVDPAFCVEAVLAAGRRMGDQAMIDAAIQREIDRKVTRAAMKAKQASILNALLCCLI